VSCFAPVPWIACEVPFTAWSDDCPLLEAGGGPFSWNTSPLTACLGWIGLARGSSKGFGSIPELGWMATGNEDIIGARERVARG